jgi:predicted PurR-regulated permease PerM
VYLLHWGAPFFIPLLVAILISYALSPLVDHMTRALRFRALSAGVVVVALLGAFAFAAWSWSDDVEAIWEKVPDAAKTVSRTVQRIAKPSRPITEVKKAAADIESVAKTGKPAPDAVTRSPKPDAAAERISVWQLLWAGWKGVTVASWSSSCSPRDRSSRRRS